MSNTQATKSLRGYTLIDRQSASSARWEIHRKDCRDISKKRGHKHHINVNCYTPEDGATSFRSYWLDEDTRELGYNEDDVKIMDCARKEAS